MADTRTEDMKHVPPIEARAAIKPHRLRYVLGIGLPLAAIALFIAWLLW
jgi:hypothetical protein